MLVQNIFFICIDFVIINGAIIALIVSDINKLEKFRQFSHMYNTVNNMYRKVIRSNYNHRRLGIFGKVTSLIGPVSSKMDSIPDPTPTLYPT